jgi:hypothetical protein
MTVLETIMRYFRKHAPRMVVFMKRKLVIAAAGLLLLSVALAWLSRPSPASPAQDFSPADFTRIREVTRRRVWQTVPHDFSVQTTKTLPRWFHRLATSHIQQIDVLPAGTVSVRVGSSSGPYYYLIEKYEKSGRWDWRVVSEGIYPQGGMVINLTGGPGYPEIRVDGGFALFGGRISSEPPADWLPPLRHPQPLMPPGTRHAGASSGEKASMQNEVSTSASNQVILSYERHPLDPDDYSPPGIKLTPKPGFSEGEFSTWISNRNILKLSH